MTTIAFFLVLAGLVYSAINDCRQADKAERNLTSYA